MKRFATALAVLIFLSGCTTTNIERKYASMPEYVREAPSVKPKVVHHEGSLWNANSDNLFADIKARHVGDIVTVVVKEQAESVNSTSVKTQRSSSGGSGLTTFIGLQNKLFKAFNVQPGENGLFNASSSSKYAASGENKANNELTATITARIVKVLPNHKLFIRGEKQIYTNGEENTIILTGIIDEYQIAADDTIDSQYIADAKIFYNGKGIVSSSKNEGWLAKLWQLIRPF
ncbi:flagellar basal body L-ring protein FlgH [Hippea jasoniae]|uniref:flagellar basal body L-ring protein FlgH n=1 Tax=Hippea jasoniae TaxID=944479 RepID=UPI00068B2957|nr:flagellar basal body L-ring protein FlgH [Hippea jasoniae]